MLSSGDFITQMLESLMVEADPAIQRIEISTSLHLDDVDVQGPRSLEPVLPEADEEDPDDPAKPDDPPPAKVTPARSSDVQALTSVVVNKNVTPARVIKARVVERIMNCSCASTRRVEI